MFAPAMLVRVIRRVAGRPRIALRVRPAINYGQARTAARFGAHHVTYYGAAQSMRVTTDASITAMTEERLFFLHDGRTADLLAAIDQVGGKALVTADHGNAEQMWDPTINGPHTAHTTNPVPFILAAEDSGRFRLRADFDTAKFSPEVKTILEALKRYGMMNADNGLDWAVSVAPDERIPVLHEELRKVKGSDFEVVVPPPGYQPAK